MMDVSNTHSRTHLHEKQLKNQNKNAHDGTRQDCPMSLKKKFRFCCVFSIFELGSIKTANRFSNENGERKDALDWIENVFFFPPWRKRTRNFEIFCLPWNFAIFNNNKILNMFFKKMFFCLFVFFNYHSHNVLSVFFLFELSSSVFVFKSGFVYPEKSWTISPKSFTGGLLKKSRKFWKVLFSCPMAGDLVFCFKCLLTFDGWLCGSDDDSSGFSLDGICYCSSVEWRERWEFFHQIEFDSGTKFCWMDFCLRVFPKLFLKKLFFCFQIYAQFFKNPIDSN